MWSGGWRICRLSKGEEEKFVIAQSPMPVKIIHENFDVAEYLRAEAGEV